MQTQDIQSTNLIFFAKSSTATEWRTISSAIQAFVDEATFEVSSECISFRAMDPSHVALIDIFWPSGAFDQFECKKQDRFTVRVEDFAKLMKRSDPHDNVEVSRSGNESLILKMGNEIYKREFELHLLESTGKSSPVPRLAFDTKAVMSCSGFAQALNDISTVSTHVTIRASSSKLVFSGKGDSGMALATLEKENNEKSHGPIYSIEIENSDKPESGSTYNIEYLLKIMKAVGSSSSGTLSLEYSAKMPLRLEFGLGESVNKVGRIHFYLAPRVGTIE